jgi:hypothetical protein
MATALSTRRRARARSSSGTRSGQGARDLAHHGHAAGLEPERGDPDAATTTTRSSSGNRGHPSRRLSHRRPITPPIDPSRSRASGVGQAPRVQVW